MKTSTKAALAGAALVVGAAVVSLRPSAPKSRPAPKYRVEQAKDARPVRDAGVLVRFESPCFREYRHDPACAELLRRFPDGGTP